MSVSEYAELTAAWTRLLNKLADLFRVPCALIMRAHETEIEVYAKSDGTGSCPYHLNERAQLNTGLYCEYVMTSGKLLVVEDARKDNDWNQNPDLALGMVSYAGLPLIGPSGEIFGTICVLDRTERHFEPRLIGFLEECKNLIETEMKLYQSRKQEEALRARNETLLKLLCHDVINPVQNGQLNVRLARLKPEQIGEALERIEGSFETIRSLVANVRGSGNASTNILSVNLREAIERAIELVSFALRDKRIQVALHVDPRLQILAERDNLSNSVLSNIFSNAVKFSHQDSTIEISAVANEDGVRLTITDHGIGMPSEMIRQILDGHPSKSHLGTAGERGTGFGLQIVKEVMRRYPNAALHIGSRPDAGSGTCVTLRFQAAAAQARSWQQPAPMTTH